MALVGDGTFSIDDFNEEFGADLPIEDYHTLAGFVFGQLGHAPGSGDFVEHDGLRFEVLEVEGAIPLVALTVDAISRCGRAAAGR